MTNAKHYTCRKVRNLLPLHVGGDLEPRHVGPVDEHLHACLTCFREFRELATLRGRLGVVGEAPLPAGALDGFTDEVMARIALDEPGPAAELPTAARPVWGSWMRAAAAVVVVGLLGWQVVSYGEPGGDAPRGALGVQAGLEPSSGLEVTTMAGVTPIGPWADLIGEAPAYDDRATNPAPTPHPAQGRLLPVDAAAGAELMPSASGPMLWRVQYPTTQPAPKLLPLEGRELRLRER